MATVGIRTSTAPNEYQIVNNYYSDKSDHTLHRLCPLFSLFLLFTECGNLFVLVAGLSPRSIGLSSSWGVVRQSGRLPPTICSGWKKLCNLLFTALMLGAPESFALYEAQYKLKIQNHVIYYNAESRQEGFLSLAGRGRNTYKQKANVIPYIWNTLNSNN